MELTKELLDFVAKAMRAHNRRLEASKVNEALKPVFQDKERTMIKTIFEEREDIGEARGVARGRAEGKAETILTILRARFRRIPKETEKAICRETDPIALDSWAVQAATCPSLNEFAQALK